MSKEDENLPFHCIVCFIENNADIVPVCYLSKSGVDMSSQLEMLPYSVCSKLINLLHLRDFDVDENLVYSMNSNYFEISELIFKMSKDTMSVFHMN